MIDEKLQGIRDPVLKKSWPAKLRLQDRLGETMEIFGDDSAEYIDFINLSSMNLIYTKFADRTNIFTLLLKYVCLECNSGHRTENST